MVRMRKAFAAVEKKRPWGWRILIPAVCFVVLTALVVAGVNNISLSAREEQLAAAEQAVRRAVAQCYAIEGRYPANLSYLQENYGLMLHEEKYVYHYRRIGGNVLPELFVFAAE